MGAGKWIGARGRRGGLREAMTRVEVLALAGIAVVLIGVVIPLLAYERRRAEEGAKLAACADHLRQLGQGVLLYAQANGGVLPVSAGVSNPHAELVRALLPRYVKDGLIFYCPAAVDQGVSFSTPNLRAGTIGYFYFSARGPGKDGRLSKFLRAPDQWPRLLDTKMEGKTWVASDIWLSGLPTAHVGYKKGVNYLMLDGAVGFLGEGPRKAWK